MGGRLTAYRAVELTARVAFVVGITAVVLASLLPADDVPGATLLSDKLVHALGYAILAGLGLLAGLRPVTAALSVIGLGLLLECAQLLTGYRSFEWLDLAADATGAAAAVILLRAPVDHWRRREAERAQERKRAERKARRDARNRPPERPMNPVRAAARKGEPAWQLVAQRQGSKCWLCGTRVYLEDRVRDSSGRERMGATYPVVDHVVALEQGGGQDATNVRLAHAACRQSRRNDPRRTTFTAPKRTYPS